MLWFVIIGVFCTRTGEEIISMSEKIVDITISNAERIGVIRNKAVFLDGKTGNLSSYGDTIAYLSKLMEHIIHSILLFAGTILLLNTFVNIKSNLYIWGLLH